MRMELEIIHSDGQVSYDFTSAEYSSIEECQATYDLMVAKGNAGSMMFRSFAKIKKVTVTSGKM